MWDLHFLLTSKTLIFNSRRSTSVLKVTKVQVNIFYQNLQLQVEKKGLTKEIILLLFTSGHKLMPLQASYLIIFNSQAPEFDFSLTALVLLA